MRKVRRTTAGMVIAFAAIVALAGCNQYDESEIVGKWKFNKGPFEMKIEYKSDNTYTSSLNAGPISGETVGEWHLQDGSIATEITKTTWPGAKAGKTDSMEIEEVSDKKMVLKSEKGTHTLRRVN